MVVMARRHTHRSRGEVGSALPLLGLVFAFLLVCTALLAGVTDRVVSRARAQSAADAAALAGVVEGRSGAEELARENQASLVSFEQSGSVVQVVVQRDGVQAAASADLELQLR